MVEISIKVTDGVSCFVNQVYVGYQDLTDTIANLESFKAQVYGGILDVRFGAFGPEYANGAFHARFHFVESGRLFITCHQESKFSEFGVKTVASCATLYLRSEPALLDRFIKELQRIPSATEGEACLEAV